MMTLKANAAAAKLETLKEATLRTLGEATDQRTMSAAIDAIKNLNSIDFSSMPSFERARDAAVLDVTNMLADVDDRSFKEKLIGIFKGDDNPIYTALAFGSAVRSFFPMLTQYVEVITSRNQKEIDGSTRIEDIGALDLNKSLRAFVEKNLQPRGLIFKAHGKGWYKKYFGNQTSSALVNDVMFLTIDELKNVVNDVRRATKPIEKTTSKNDDQKSTVDDPKQRVKTIWKKISDDMGDLSAAEQNIVVRTIVALQKQELLTQ